MATNLVRTALIGAGFLVLGGGLGYYAGTAQRVLDPEPRAPASAAPAAAPEAAAPVVEMPSPESRPEPAPEVTVLSLLELPTDFEQTAALYRLLEKSDGIALRRHIEDAKLIPTVGDRRAAMGILFLRLSELEPDNTLAVLDGMNVRERSSVLFSVFNGWSKVNLDAAIARLDDVPAGRDRQAAANGIFQAYADDPETLAHISRKVAGNSSLAAWGRQMGVTAKARLDPLGALQEAIELTMPQHRLRALTEVANVWAQTAPREALRNADLILVPMERQNFRNAVFMSVASQSPGRALELMDVAEGTSEKQQLISAVFGRMVQSNAMEAMSEARSLEDPNLRRLAMDAVFNVWGNSDPAGAAQALLGIDDPALVQRVAQRLVFQYARVEPRGTLAWAERIDGRKGRLWEQALAQVGQTSPEFALETVAALPPSPRQAQLLQSVLGAVSDRDPQLALAFVEDLPPGQRRAQAMARIVASWARMDLEAALDWLAGSPEREQVSLASQVAYVVLNADLSVGKNFARRLDGRALEAWIDPLVSHFSQVDPTGAADWISDFSEEPAFGRWAGVVAAGLARTDPGAALDLVGAIDSMDQRRVATNQLLSAWADVDARAAARWLDQAREEVVVEGMYSVVAGRWYHFDPRGALSWARALNDTNYRDLALMSIAGSEFLETLEAADIINEIDSDSMRYNALNQRIYQLARFDAGAARALLDAVALSETQRQELTAVINGLGGG